MTHQPCQICPICGGEIERLQFVVGSDMIVVDGSLVQLSPVTYRIMQALAQPFGIRRTRKEIMDEVYADYADPPFDQTVNVHFQSLKKKLEGTALDIVRTRTRGTYLEWRTHGER